MATLTKVDIEKGKYIFKLEQLLAEKHISKNKLMRETNTDYKVIQRLSNGSLTRVDIFVLARFCDYLNCNLTDIIEYEK